MTEPSPLTPGRKITRSETAETPRTVISTDHTSSPTYGPLEQYERPLKRPRSANDASGHLLNEIDTPSRYAEEDNSYRSNIAPVSLPSIYLETPVWPLTDPAEAILLRHFVQNLAIWVRTLSKSLLILECR